MYKLILLIGLMISSAAFAQVDIIKFRIDTSKTENLIFKIFSNSLIYTLDSNFTDTTNTKNYFLIKFSLTKSNEIVNYQSNTTSKDHNKFVLQAISRWITELENKKINFDSIKEKTIQSRIGIVYKGSNNQIFDEKVNLTSLIKSESMFFKINGELSVQDVCINCIIFPTIFFMKPYSEKWDVY